MNLKLFNHKKDFAPGSPAAGSALFFRLSPTCRVAEYITFVFGPVFMGWLGSALGVWGVIVGAIVGSSLSWFAVYIRRHTEYWALDANKKFEKYFADNAFEIRKFKGPHPNLPLVTGTLMATGEVLALCLVSTFFLSYLYYYDIHSLRVFFNSLQPYIGDFFSLYSGLDHEIKALVHSAHSGRVVILKLASFFIFVSCAYGCVIVSIRMLHGWREYWRILNIIRDDIIIKKESIVLWTLVLSVFMIASGIDSLFYQGFEYFLIMDKVPDEGYLPFSLLKLILVANGFTMEIFIQLSILLPYIVTLFFYYVYSQIYSHSSPV
jgi:hypothetical protein